VEDLQEWDEAFLVKRKDGYKRVTNAEVQIILLETAMQKASNVMLAGSLKAISYLLRLITNKSRDCPYATQGSTDAPVETS
jgi:hypothetical protein